LTRILVRPRARAFWPAAACLLLSWAGQARAQRVANVSVTGLDYAFQAPDTLRGGPTAFAFENHGKRRHEVIIYRLRTGVSVDSVVHADRAARRALTELVGILVAEPGEKPLGRILVDLSPGRTYLLVCSLQDAPDKPPHVTLGMLHPLKVSSRSP
jgi:hypothetical protein